MPGPSFGITIQRQTATPSTNMNDKVTADTVQNDELSKKGTFNESAVTEKKTLNQIKKETKQQAKLQKFSKKQEQKQSQQQDLSILRPVVH